METSKKNQLIGLDIGSHSIKLVEIEHGKKGPVLKNLGIMGLPHEAIFEGSIKEPEIVSSAVRNLFRNLRVKNKNVATSVSGFSVIVKKITLDSQAESTLEATIQEEAEQYVPFDMAEVNLDFDILPTEEAGGDGSTQMDIMLVAAKKDVVESYAGLLVMAGLNPAVIDVDVFALQNAFELIDPSSKGSHALVNVGAEELGINMLKDGVALFTRDSSYGGAQLTRALMREFDVSFEDAEKIKLGGKQVEGGDKRLEKIFKDAVSEWSNEIKRALDFVASTHPGQTFDAIHLSGGSSRIPGFAEYLETMTKIPVKRFNPFAALAVNEKAMDPAYLDYMSPQSAVAVGLALRSIGDK
ncbi:MAG: type IV pilus assembly protein PilM [Deltaproteobacteria bacterium]|nr:type IV pilus assembly protein PilM [Deltaproteobacteria bacterium]